MRSSARHVSLGIDVVVHVARSADGRRRVAALAGQDRGAGGLRDLDDALLSELLGRRCPS